MKNKEGYTIDERIDSLETSNSLQSSSSNNITYNKIDSSSQEPQNLYFDDSEYPYAGIPRIIILTENEAKIKSRETEIPAKFQIWGKDSPESEIMELTIRGRGHTSWVAPKKNYKIEFLNKQSLLGMPQNRDWALIANYSDKTLMKNYLMNHLSRKINVFYAPRCEFVELYINNEYLGVYLLTETIKIAKNRVNIPENTNSYIVEMAQNYYKNDQVVFSHVITSDSIGKPFHVHFPKKASKETLSIIESFIEKFENYLKSIKENKDNNINLQLDINECVKHYWVQEFSKNPDAVGYSSVYFTWVNGGLIRMGPVWDFDLAFGSHRTESINEPEKWYIKTGYWHNYIFKDSIANEVRLDFWKDNRDILIGTIDVADSIRILLQNAAKNNFKRWDILKSTEYNYHRHSYSSYDNAVEDLKKWICKRVEWIDKQLNSD